MPCGVSARNWRPGSQISSPNQPTCTLASPQYLFKRVISTTTVPLLLRLLFLPLLLFVVDDFIIVVAMWTLPLEIIAFSKAIDATRQTLDLQSGI